MLNINLESIKTTKEFFQLDSDNLLEFKDLHTKEECLLFDSGVEVVFFDDMEEIEEEREEFEEYIQNKGYEIKNVLKTINERIAIVLI